MTEFDYELFAIRYATRDAQRSAHFIGGDPHDGPMPMDYFVWVAKGGGRTFVIDTGFNAEVSERRKRTFLRCPVQALAALGIDANAVEDVILTHLHYDHVGNFDRFPKAVEIADMVVMQVGENDIFNRIRIDAEGCERLHGAAQERAF